MQAAFVATDGHTIGRIFEDRTTRLALVVQTVDGEVDAACTAPLRQAA